MNKILTLFFFVIVVYAQHSFDAKSKEPEVGFRGQVVETRKRIGVLDTGVSREQLKKNYMCKDMPIFKAAGTGMDYDGHGTNVIGLVAEQMNAKKYCITSYSISKTNNNMGEFNYLLYKMQDHNLVGLNISWANTGYDESEGMLLKKLTNKGVKVFIAAGNSKINLDLGCLVYPACHKLNNPKIYVVGNKKGTDVYSNYGRFVDAWVDGVEKGTPKMSGSSQSTAIATGVFFSK